MAEACHAMAAAHPSTVVARHSMAGVCPSMVAVRHRTVEVRHPTGEAHLLMAKVSPRMMGRWITLSGSA